MAIAFVKVGATSFNKTASASFTFTVPAGGHALGNRLIAVVATLSNALSGTASITDAGGNTWTLESVTSSASNTVQILSAPLTTALIAGDLITVSVSVGGSNRAYAATYGEYSGVATGVTADFGSSATSTTPTITSGSVASGGLFVGALLTNGPVGDTFTQDTDTVNGSWTSSLTRAGSTGGSGSSNVTVASGQKIVTAAGAQTWNPTITSAAWVTTGARYSAAPPPVLAPPPPQVIRQAVKRASTWMKRHDHIVVPRLWTPADVVGG